MARQRIGAQGEILAALALERVGYTVLERNWRCSQGELDIVARHGGELVFVEVRARTDGVDSALESISARKRARLEALAQAYLAAHDLDDAPFRIDVAAVNPRTSAVEIIENAVGW